MERILLLLLLFGLENNEVSGNLRIYFLMIDWTTTKFFFLLSIKVLLMMLMILLLLSLMF